MSSHLSSSLSWFFFNIYLWLFKVLRVIWNLLLILNNLILNSTFNILKICWNSFLFMFVFVLNIMIIIISLFLFLKKLFLMIHYLIGLPSLLKNYLWLFLLMLKVLRNCLCVVSIIGTSIFFLNMNRHMLMFWLM